MKAFLASFLLLFLVSGIHPAVAEEEEYKPKSCYQIPQTMFCNGVEDLPLNLLSQCDPTNLPPAMLVSSIFPLEGTVGRQVQVDGDFFAAGGPPQVFLEDGSRYEMTLLEYRNLRLFAQVPDVIPAGVYNLLVEKCDNDSNGIPYRVRAPSSLVFSPIIVIHGAEVTMTGEFLGEAEGRITVQEQNQPPGPEQEAEIISWTEGTVKFIVPAAFTKNGLLNVTVINGTGSVQRVGVLNLIGLENDEGLQVVSAVATSNTEILVQFSEPVIGGITGAENTENYQIFGPEVDISGAEASGPGPDKPDRAVIGILSAELLTTGFSTVRLTTISQSDLLYTVTVSSVFDLTGHSFVPPSILAPHPNSAQFVGVSPSGGPPVDSDGDGISDSDEQAGWIVYVTTADGSITGRHVTSDPGNPLLDVDDPVNVAARDTDGDGVTDNEEKHGALDPRTADTDGDTLTDDEEWNTIFSDGTNQDSDGDGVQDGFEYFTFRTSPILADTDGDQIPDPVEVSAGNRNPLIADLPAPRISIGNFNMLLKTIFTYTDDEGMVQTDSKTSDATLTSGQDDTFNSSNENSTKATVENSQEVTLSGEYNFPGGSVSASATAGFKQGSERGNTFSSGESSSRKSEEAYHDSLSSTVANEFRQTVSREIDDAAIKVDVSIDNLGDIPFSISNLELTAQTQDPNDRRRIIPVASLVPENENLGTPDNPINIGALGDAARGPFVFKTTTVFPEQVEELMKNPRGFVVQLANYDITDEAGRNFAFTSQEVLERTAGISFDLGDGRQESYRVATASAHNPANGEPLGITMEYALNGIIGLHNRQTIRDGGNGIVNTSVDGDDELVKDGFTPGAQIEPGEVIVTAGADGILQTVPGADDVIAEPDYATKALTELATIREGGNGVVNTSKTGDDVQQVPLDSPAKPGQVIITPGPNMVIDTIPGDDDVLVPASPPHEVLSRFRDITEDLPTHRSWVLFSERDLPAVNLDEIVIRAGEDYGFAYVQDKDDDGVYAREEFLHKSSDLLINTDSCTDPDAGPRPADNCDTLNDDLEIQEGWQVQLKSSPEPYNVYPNPNQGDSDRDALLDHDEWYCRLDPRQRDTDLDGLTDWEELRGKLLVDGGPNGEMVSRDPTTDQVLYTITPYLGISGALITHAYQPDVNEDFCGLSGYATDPLDPDTDGDEVSDFVELELGLNPNDPLDGASYLDDDGDGVSNKDEREGFVAYVNCGDNPTASQLTVGNPGACAFLFTSNPQDPDSDDDDLPDLLEHFIRSNPLEIDTDGDELTDANEYENGGQVCVTKLPGEPCEKFGDLPVNNFQQFVTQCDNADVCNNSVIEAKLLAIGSKQYGTNINEWDSDFDTLSDKYELVGDRSITVNGSSKILPAPVSDPLDKFTDADGWHDGTENANGTDPDDDDTDGDLLQDDLEAARGRDPRYKDKRVKATTSDFVITECGDGPGACEMHWWAAVSYNGATPPGPQICTYSESVDVGSAPSVNCTYFQNIVIRDEPTSKVLITMDAWEDDVGADDECSDQISEFTYANSINDTRTLSMDCNGDLKFNVPIAVTVD